MKTVKIGIIEFDVEACKKMSKKEFLKTHSKTCEKFNVDVEVAYEKLKGKSTPKKD